MLVRLLEAQRDRIDGWIRSATALRHALDKTIEGNTGRTGERSARASCPVVRRGLHERALIAAEDIASELPMPVALGGSRTTRGSD